MVKLFLQSFNMLPPGGTNAQRVTHNTFSAKQYVVYDIEHFTFDAPKAVASESTSHSTRLRWPTFPFHRNIEVVSSLIFI